MLGIISFYFIFILQLVNCGLTTMNLCFIVGLNSKECAYLAHAIFMVANESKRLGCTTQSHLKPMLRTGVCHVC